MSRIRRFLVFLSLAFSLGGFTFYAGVVVPIGGELLGPDVQGFVTQRVTHFLNAANLVTCIVLAWDWRYTRRKSRLRSKFGLALWLTYAVTIAVLMANHAMLDRMLDFEDLAVSDPGRFYSWHRLYLWVSTLQWCLLLVFAWNWFAQRPDPVE